MSGRESKRRRRVQLYSVQTHEMLIKDSLRTASYKKAIENNVRSTDVVLDIGCGTGILSFFAARKGCKKIYAIDNEDMIDCAEETARRNDLHHNIEFIKADVLRVAPEEKIDVLIHEQIGTFVWDEGLISKVACVRDNFLKKTGRIIPFKIDLYLAPTSYRSHLDKSMSFWSRKHYGIDFANLRKKLFVENVGAAAFPSRIELHDRGTFLCREKLAHTIDLRKASGVPRKISATFRVKENSRLTGMCAYFRVHLDDDTCFSTGPRKTNTHWGQIFLPCFEEKRIRRNSILNFTLVPKIRQNKWKSQFDIRTQ